jgi:hypothetical protein
MATNDNNLRVPDELRTQAAEIAKRQGRTADDLAADALKRYIAHERLEDGRHFPLRESIPNRHHRSGPARHAEPRLARQRGRTGFSLAKILEGGNQVTFLHSAHESPGRREYGLPGTEGFPMA